MLSTLQCDCGRSFNYDVTVDSIDRSKNAQCPSCDPDSKGVLLVMSAKPELQEQYEAPVGTDGRPLADDNAPKVSDRPAREPEFDLSDPFADLEGAPTSSPSFPLIPGAPHADMAADSGQERELTKAEKKAQEKKAPKDVPVDPDHSDDPKVFEANGGL